MSILARLACREVCLGSLNRLANQPNSVRCIGRSHMDWSECFYMASCGPCHRLKACYSFECRTLPSWISWDVLLGCRTMYREKLGTRVVLHVPGRRSEYSCTDLVTRKRQEIMSSYQPKLGPPYTQPMYMILLFFWAPTYPSMSKLTEG